MDKILEKLTNELTSRGIGTNVAANSDDTITMTVPGYDLKFVRQKKESLMFYDSSSTKTDEKKKKTFNILRFTKTGEKAPENCYYLHENDDVTKIASWIDSKIKNPTGDAELLAAVKKMKDAIDAMNIDFLITDRHTAISPEFEDFGDACRTRAVLIMYNDLVTEDYMILQAKRMISQPGEPILYILRTLDSTNTTMTEEEFDPSGAADTVKVQIIMKCMELSDSVSEGSKEYEELQKRLNI
jgi:hypothetical protein